MILKDGIDHRGGKEGWRKMKARKAEGEVDVAHGR